MKKLPECEYCGSLVMPHAAAMEDKTAHASCESSYRRRYLEILDWAEAQPNKAKDNVFDLFCDLLRSGDTAALRYLRESIYRWMGTWETADLGAAITDYAESIDGYEEWERQEKQKEMAQ